MQSQKLKLDPPTRVHLEQLCQDPMNWTDGGHWMGTGTAPECLGKTVIASNERKYTIEFKLREEAVLEWNKMVESNYNTISNCISVASFLLSIHPAISTINGIRIGAIGVMGGITVGGLNKPTVLKGWSVTIITQNSLTWSSLSQGESFFQKVQLQVRNNLGKIMHHSSNEVEFTASSIQERNLFEKIARMPSREKTELR